MIIMQRYKSFRCLLLQTHCWSQTEPSHIYTAGTLTQESLSAVEEQEDDLIAF